MIEIRTTADFDKWIGKLKDRKARGVILARINRLYEGLEGDIKPVGKGVSELRVHFGPGYRVYLTQRGDVLIIVLCAGSKKTQQRDIQRAQELAKDLEV
jgi:putative addiction module killer protein